MTEQKEIADPVCVLLEADSLRAMSEFETPRCKNCKFWDDGECNGVGEHDAGFGWEQNPAVLFDIDVRADDDSGLGFKLKTGPEFGCVRFVSKEPRE